MTDKTRRMILSSGVAASCLVLSGCLTRKLWKVEYETHRFAETIDAILISNDGKKLVIIGKEKDYIFDAPKNLINIIKSEIHPDVACSFGTFTIKTNGKISGIFILTIDKDKISKEKEEIAKSLEFKSGGIWNDISIRLEIDGVAYAKNKNAPNPIPIKQKLNKPYSINVEEESTPMISPHQILFTPITIAIDGTLIIGVITLILITWPIHNGRMPSK